MLAPRVLIRTLGLRKMIYSRCSCPPKWRIKYLRLKFSCDGFHPPAFQKWCERMGIFWTPTLGKNSHWSPGCEISNKCVRRNHKVNTTSCLVINSPRQKGPVRFGMRFLWFLLAFFWPLSLKLAWNMIRFFRLGLKGPKPIQRASSSPGSLFLMERILRYFRIQNWCQVLKVHYFSKSQL